MPNGEKQVPQETASSSQERISQLLGGRCVGIPETETLAQVISRLGEEGGENYSLSQSTVIFRSVEEKAGLGKVETLHVLGPRDPFTGNRAYSRFYRGQELKTIIQELNLSDKDLENLGGSPGSSSLPIVKTPERPMIPMETLTVDYQGVFLIPGYEKTQAELMAEAVETYELLTSGEASDRFNFQKDSSEVVILETGRLIRLGSPDKEGRLRGWWVPLQRLETSGLAVNTEKAPHQFRVGEIKVAYLSDELPAPGAGDLPQRRQLVERTVYDSGSFRKEEREIAILDWESIEGDAPPADAWRLTTFHPGIEKIVKIPLPESK